MSDDRHEPANDAEETRELGDEDRLPWLEAVEEDEDGGDGPSVAKLIAVVVIGLVAIGVILGGLFWLGNRNQPGGNGEMIAAPEGDYKVRPENPGGMNVSEETQVAAAASNGATPQGNLALNAPEAPVRPGPAAPHPAAPAPAPAPAPGPAPGHPAPPPHPGPAPAPAQPAPAAAGGATVQLGAFSNEAAANRAWGALSARFRYLAPLNHSVVATQVGGRTLYRLRAAGPGATDICRRLQVAGEACASVN
jgi:hypothetical protein